jgi:hypothetical protein
LPVVTVQTEAVIGDENARCAPAIFQQGPSVPKYFFNITNGHPFRDAVGEDLPDDSAAWEQAVRTVRDIEASLNLDGSSKWSLEVKRDETSIFRIDVAAQRTDSSRP